MIHEFAHSLHLLSGDDEFNSNLNASYTKAILSGLWPNTYAGSNAVEYWAEGVMSWFDCNKYVSPPDGTNNDINTRDKIKTYDPTLAGLLIDFFWGFTNSIHLS